MSLLIDAGILVLLAIVMFQDFKQGQISWILIPFLFILISAKGLLSLTIKELFNDTVFNCGFILIQLVMLTLYFSIKSKKIVNIVDSYLGLGDILFFVIICGALSPVNFIFFYLISLIVVLIAVLIFRATSKTNNKEIPLAGAMSIIMMVAIVVNFFYPRMNFHNDDFLVSCFIK